jgi:hypothetical protein
MERKQTGREGKKSQAREEYTKEERSKLSERSPWNDFL